MQQAINAASGYLPKNLPTPPTYRKTNPAERPILIYAVSSDAIPIYQLDQYANVDLGAVVVDHFRRRAGADRRRAAAGRYRAGQPRGAGGARRQPRAGRRPRSAAKHSKPPKGNLEGPHQQFALQTNDQLFDPSQFRKVIMAYQNGAPVTVGDIGDVINSSTNPRTGAWFDRDTTLPNCC